MPVEPLVPEPPARERLEAEVRRVVDRLRVTALTTLGRPVEGWPSRAAAGHALAQALADAAAAAEGEPRRTLPDLGTPVVADQVAVCAADLLSALAGRTPPAELVELAERVRRAL